METIVALIDRVLVSHTDEAVIEAVANEVNDMMSEEVAFFNSIKV
jgi:glycine hydroxymethyltransferase